MFRTIFRPIFVVRFETTVALSPSDRTKTLYFQKKQIHIKSTGNAYIFTRNINTVLTEETPLPASTYLLSKRVKAASNTVEFRFPKDEFWILESMARDYSERGYVLKPTVTALARMSLSIAVNDYINKEKPIPQKLREIVPLKSYNRLIRELELKRTENLSLRRYYSRSQNTIEEQNRTIQDLSTVLKQANKKLEELGISTILDGAHVHDKI